MRYLGLCGSTTGRIWRNQSNRPRDAWDSFRLRPETYYGVFNRATRRHVYGSPRRPYGGVSEIGQHRRQSGAGGNCEEESLWRKCFDLISRSAFGDGERRCHCCHGREWQRQWERTWTRNKYGQDGIFDFACDQRFGQRGDEEPSSQSGEPWWALKALENCLQKGV